MLDTEKMTQMTSELDAAGRHLDRASYTGAFAVFSAITIIACTGFDYLSDQSIDYGELEVASAVLFVGAPGLVWAISHVLALGPKKRGNKLRDELLESVKAE